MSQRLPDSEARACLPWPDLDDLDFAVFAVFFDDDFAAFDDFSVFFASTFAFASGRA